MSTLRNLYQFLKAFINFLKHLVRFQLKDKYCIKTFYVSHKENLHLDATGVDDKYQQKVYEGILDFFQEKEFSKLLDFGCGSGFKLMKYFGEYDTLGLELPPALDHLKEKYTDKKWLKSDFSTLVAEEFDMAISVDVIEHLQDPDQLLDFFEKLNCQYFALGTPDRDQIPGGAKLGPPNNHYHIREWNREEFINYLSKRFKIIKSEVVSGHEHYVIFEKK